MERRQFEKLGIESSLLGFGCMRFPLDENGNIEEKEAEEMLDMGMETSTSRWKNYIYKTSWSS